MNNEVRKDVLQWDVLSWSKALNYWEEKVNWNNINTALELGARDGGLSLWLALKGKQVVCSDLISPENYASKLHQKYNVAHNIRYQAIDALNIPYQNHFDVIVFKSILGGIGRNNNFENQQKVILEIYKALKPNGILLFAENLKGSSLHQWMRKKFVKWGKEWRYIDVNELKQLLKPFSKFEIRTNGVIATFGRNESQRNFLAKWDNILFNKICPDSWKYIGYGLAVK